MASSLKHCPSCGALVRYEVPADDNRPRAVCTSCSTVHYQNPVVVVGTVPTWVGQVLLCRRAIEPRRGLWTLPAGFLEMGETMRDGARRETLEEAGARIELGSLFTQLDVVHVGQIHAFYRADLVDIDFAPGPESLEVRLFDEQDIPWSELAFRTVKRTLELFFEDRRLGVTRVHEGQVV